jgi:hypothetical protein
LFGGKTRLVRFIHPNQRLQGNRAAADAFIEPRRQERSTAHMSVHSLGLTARETISAFYQSELQSSGTIAASIHSVYEYNKATYGTPAAVKYDLKTKQWLFAERGTNSPAYMQRPTPNCLFHCGIEYVRALNDTDMQKVARRLANKKLKVL